jgi:hypothetical protein
LNKITYIDYVKSKENIVNLLTKGLLRELVYNSSRKIGLKPLKIKECNDGNHTLCTGDFKIYVLIKKLIHIIFSITLENYYFILIPIMKRSFIYSVIKNELCS